MCGCLWGFVVVAIDASDGRFIYELLTCCAIVVFSDEIVLDRSSLSCSRSRNSLVRMQTVSDKDCIFGQSVHRKYFGPSPSPWESYRVPTRQAAVLIVRSTATTMMTTRFYSGLRRYCSSVTWVFCTKVRMRKIGVGLSSLVTIVHRPLAAWSTSTLIFCLPPAASHHSSLLNCGW